MASTITTFAAFLKRLYTTKRVEDLTEQDNTLLGMLTKDPSLQGESLTVPMITTAAQGVAASRSVSQTNQTNVQGRKFVVTTGDYFGTVSIGHKAMKTARGNPGSFLRNQQTEIDSLYATMGNAIEHYLWGNGGNSIGQIASISTDVITLTNPADTYNFYEGMECALSEGDGSSSGHSIQAGTFTIESVDPGAGTITGVAGEIAALTGEDADDYIFRAGDFTGNTGLVVIDGLQKQLSGGASPATLYSMVRTTGNRAQLAGCWVPSGDLSTRNIEQRLIRLGTLMSGRFKAKVGKTWFLHPEDWEVLSYSMQSQGVRRLEDSSTKAGYEYLEIIAGGKRGRVYQSAGAPKGIGWNLNLEYWTLASIDQLIHVLDGDGLSMLRSTSADEYEYRLTSFPALYTNAPLHNGRVSLT